MFYAAIRISAQSGDFLIAVFYRSPLHQWLNYSMSL